MNPWLRQSRLFPVLAIDNRAPMLVPQRHRVFVGMGPIAEEHGTWLNQLPNRGSNACFGVIWEPLEPNPAYGLSANFRRYEHTDFSSTGSVGAA